MELTDLLTFSTVARLGGITRAAAPLALGVGAGGEVFFNDLAQEV